MRWSRSCASWLLGGWLAAAGAGCVPQATLDAARSDLAAARRLLVEREAARDAEVKALEAKVTTLENQVMENEAKLIAANQENDGLRAEVAKHDKRHRRRRLGGRAKASVDASALRRTARVR